MGGRGASSGRVITGVGGTIRVSSTTDLITQRGNKQKEVDDTLTVLRDVYNKYDLQINEVQVANLGRNDNTMAYFSNGNNLAVSKKYFSDKQMNEAYDSSIRNGFHPPRGNKSGMEAVVAHELGHALTYKASNGDWDKIDSLSKTIIQEASKKFKASTGTLMKRISGYAETNFTEAIAEAFSDVYCNGRKAKRISKAVVSELEKLL